MDGYDQTLALRFWQAAGEPAAFPRNLEETASLDWPLDILWQARLCPTVANAWLAAHGWVDRVPHHPPALRGLLVARRGHGVIMIDAGDPPDQQRFTLAHEVAHFLADYDAPRRRVLARLGAAAAALLDGERLPTLAERADAVLAGVTLGAYTHLLPRVVGAGAVAAVEQRADHLALELVVPWATARCWLRALPASLDRRARQGVLATRLAAQGGLPPEIAAEYAGRLVRLCDGAQTFSEWLGLSGQGAL